MIPARLEEALALILSEATECIAADRIICGYTAHNEQLAETSVEAQRIWRFIEQAVCWKYALAVNRLLQPAGKDRASLLGFCREVEKAKDAGFTLPDIALFVKTASTIWRIHNSPEVAELRECRDGFMAHALIGGRRTGMKLEILRDLADKTEKAIDALHVAVIGSESPLHDRYCDWLEWSDPWWEKIFPDN